MTHTYFARPPVLYALSPVRYGRCIGKDLSKIAMPVNFNEPLSFTQRLCEDMEHVLKSGGDIQSRAGLDFPDSVGSVSARMMHPFGGCIVRADKQTKST